MVSHLEKLLFTRELAVLLKSGVPLGEALQSLQGKTGRGSLRKVIDSLLSDIENGQSFSQALSRFPKIFDALSVNLVKIGEASGTLKENLDFLARQQESSYTLRKKIQAILLYPTIVFGAALILSALISVFILPKLIHLFESFHVTLPWTTRALLALASFMQDHGILFFSALFLFVLVFRFMVKLSFVRPYWHAVLLRLPVSGELTRYIAIAHFCRDVGTMLQSGLPVLEALIVEERVMENRAMARLVKNLSSAVAQGRTLSDELVKPAYAVIPVIAIKMIASGEKTGKLDETLLYLESFFETEVDRKVKNMTVLFEPVLLLVIGGIVTFLALAILTPIYSLTGSVRR
jgi:type II secretory pathway component PulF